jgi:hypothetical protein
MQSFSFSPASQLLLGEAKVKATKLFAYADPPYYKKGKLHYGELHKDAYLWDSKESHLELIQSLKDNYPDGWAMSCNSNNLWWLLENEPDIRVCIWTKGFHQIRQSTIQYAYEPVLLWNGRKELKRRPMVRDWISCNIAMRRGLVGSKPLAFNLWILDLLNYKLGDQLDDIFPGTAGMAEAIKVKEELLKTAINGVA